MNTAEANGHEEYNSGFSKGHADCTRGACMSAPEFGPMTEWRSGYEAGWEAAFFAKVRQRTEQTNRFQIQPQ